MNSENNFVTTKCMSEWKLNYRALELIYYLTNICTVKLRKSLQNVCALMKVIGLILVAKSFSF